LECFSLYYIICDYFALPFHASKIVLNQICLNSKNFLERRKLKDVVNNYMGDDSGILEKNDRILADLGK